MNTADQFHLQWRGQQIGPWDIGKIRGALADGSIHSLYQIHADGRWQPLRDFLEKNTPVREAPVRPAPTPEPPPAPNPVPTPPAEVPVTVAPKLVQPPPLPTQRLPPPFTPVWQAGPPMSPAPYGYQRTSGLAIASLVLSLCFLIPFVNFISWILSLVFGHVALVQMKGNPTLGGRGLALAGLIITYSVLALFVLLVIINIILQRY